ncbi:MAG: sigma-70 family RNA polymerase sigma factor [Eubacterium sp.]|nr:sigma-70 family RNA polymerase sigma factor [Eubacterium sp.]
MNKPKINEKNYIERLKAKDQRALEYIIERYGGLLYSIIRKKLTLIPDKVDECFNDVLLKMWDHAEDYDEEKCEFKGWLAAIARYQAIDYLRIAKREEFGRAAESLEDLANKTCFNDERFREIEESIDNEFEKLISCLAPIDQEIFRRLYERGDSMDDISRDMNIPKKQLYNHTSRGKKKIRDRFLFKKEHING